MISKINAEYFGAGLMSISGNPRSIMYSAILRAVSYVRIGRNDPADRDRLSGITGGDARPENHRSREWIFARHSVLERARRSSLRPRADTNGNRLAALL